MHLLCNLKLIIKIIFISRQVVLGCLNVNLKLDTIRIILSKLDRIRIRGPEAL